MTNPILPPAMSLVSYLAWGTCAILAFAFYQFLLIVRPATKKGFQPIPSPPEASLISGHTTLWKRVGVRPDQTAVVQWAREYGEIFQIRTGIYRWVFLNSPEAIKEVFDKNGASTASKKPMPMMQDTLSGGYRLLFMPYGNQWRSLRSVIHHLLTPKAAQTYKPQQDLESKRYLHDLLTDPEHFRNHVRRYTSSIMMYSTYGRRVLDLNDPTLTAIYEELLGFSTVMGKWYLCETFPILARIVPKPLQWWRREGNRYHQEERKLWLGLWNNMKEQVAAGKGNGCFAEGFMKTEYKKLGIPEVQAAYVCGSMIEAGSDTTQMTLNNLILGLTAYPDVVRKAQEELDRVIGSNRMPTFEDSAELPYIRAMVKEVLRWRATINGVFSHYTTADVVYKNYLIPKNTILAGNHWAIHYDSEIHTEPERFNPDRFLGLDLTAGECAVNADPSKRDHYAFGAGRRLCPGLHLAENSLFILSARLLWAFDVSSPKDPVTGANMPNNVWAYPHGISTDPLPYKATITVRDEHRAQLIETSWAEAEKDWVISGH